MRSPVNALTTSTVIGIALALPMGLYVLLDNVNAVSRNWESGAQVSLYLSTELSDADAVAFAERLSARVEVERVEIITKAEARNISV